MHNDQVKVQGTRGKLGGWTKTNVHLIETELQINQTLCTYLLRGINQQWIEHSEY